MSGYSTEATPVDAIPANGWIMELPGMTSPHISKVTGLKQSTDKMVVVDGGSNREFYFSSGILKHEPITISRVRDGSDEDKKFDAFFQSMLTSGAKINGTFLQFRYGRKVLSIQFQGLLCNELTLGDFDTESNDKSMQSITAQVDFMETKYNSDI